MKLLKILELPCYIIVRTIFGLFGLFCLVNLIVLTTHVSKAYNPKGLSKNWLLGNSDYVKGIPVPVATYMPIPDSNFTWTRQYPSGASVSGFRTVSYGDQAPESNHQIEDQLKSTTMIYGDTIVSRFHGADHLRPDPSIKAVSVDGLTFYIWPEDRKERFLFFMPIFIPLLDCFICSLIIFLLTGDIRDKEKMFTLKTLWKIALIGFTIIASQLALFYVGETAQFKHEYSVQTVSSIQHYRLPLELRGTPQSPFTAYWLVIGILVLCFIPLIHRGFVLHRRNKISI